MKSLSTALTLFAAFAVFLVTAPVAQAESGFFSNNCAGCHNNVSSTCAGCHAHGVHSNSSKGDINLTGTTDKNSYAAGETVAVTIDGGYRSGWVRAILYDENMNELARSTGPNGKGGGASLPVTLSAPAPTTPGNYTWSVAWYGNQYDLDQRGGKTVFGNNWTPDPNNPGHGQEIVATNTFTVAGSPTASAISLNPTALGFGTVTVGASATQASQVQDLGDAPLEVTAITRCPGTSSEFTWSPAAPFTVDVSGSQALSVTYAPSDTSADTGCLQIASNDPSGVPVTLDLSGAGVQTVPQMTDIDISRLQTTKRVSLKRVNPVEPKLVVSNPGSVTGSADATLIGTQNGTQVYYETIVVAVDAGSTARYKFPAYVPDAVGTIEWVVTVNDQDPDVDTASAATKVVK